ncbi:response regulator [Leptolyngbya sp. CCY15150]|uniref:response regulator n=1 Tax=Leptolyngbya sp. CCY15150 TaxID=2767772 RepID=UPI001951F322|nr:response regulator [Leptolyngbya sp. CCY15150]
MTSPNANLLVIDDQVDHVRMMSALLVQHGYDVRKALSGRMALSTIQAERPDLILLDVRMPDMDGYELCATLKSQPDTCDIPVIFLSAEDQSQEKVRAFEVGAVDYITKPVQTGEILARISCQLTIVRQKQQLLDQNKRLQQQEDLMRQSMRQERLLRLITQRIRQSLQLQDVLNVAVSEVQQLLSNDRALIFRFQTDWSGTVIAEAVSDPALSIIGETIHDPCFASDWHRPYEQGHIRAIDDVTQSSLQACHVEMLESLQVKANLVVPILQAENLWGLLIVQHCKQPRAWQSWEASMLQQLAGQLAIAIQQSELHHQLQHLNNDLERQVKARTTELQIAFEFEDTLKRITDKVRDTLDEDLILETAVRELTQALGVCGCNASRYNLQTGLATVVYEYTTLPGGDYKDRSVALSAFPELYQPLMQGESIQFCSLLSNVDRGPVVSLACPIFDDQGILGDLWLIDHTYQARSEQDLRLVRQVANQCAIAIRQARLYQSAQAQVQNLERLNLLKDDFLSTISHELRTPLASIRVATQMLQITFEQLGITDERANRYLSILHQESIQEISLINDLLDLQHLDAGTKPLELDTIDLKAWSASIVDTFQIRAEAQQQNFEAEIAEDLPPIVTDPASLKRIMTELLNNACKYTPPGDRILLAVQVKDNQLHLRFQNFGVQIPDSELPYIFDKFYRITNSDRWKHGGTGLGLTLTKKLVEYLGGTIQVYSPEQSTCFTICLPLRPARLPEEDWLLADMLTDDHYNR